MLDRFDLRIEMPPVAFKDLDLPAASEGSAEVAQRVAIAREIQADRYRDNAEITLNADAEGDVLEKAVALQAESRALLLQAAERFGLSARGYHRVLRVARTIADLAAEPQVQRPHLAEALNFRTGV
jgi:magnesium chelatase family protein